MLSGRLGSSAWQQLDLNQLHHNFLQSIWNLQSQPPLYNVATAVLVRLPYGLAHFVLVIGALLLGLGIALCAFWLLIELGVPRSGAFGVAVLVVLDPSAVLYENWYFYTYPTAFLVVLAALSLTKYLKRQQPLWGVCFFSSVSLVVLLNSTFQWPWLLVVIGAVVVLLRHRWRAVLAVGLVPVALVAFWYGKNAVLFHTTTTSSWTGMNLARITTEQASTSELQSLLKAGKITSASTIIPFTAPPSAYGPRLSHHARTGVAVLDDPNKGDGSINFNNIRFIAISDQYLHNDLHFIEAYPGLYARSVMKASTVFLLPSDQYIFVASNQSKISTYARVYDLVVNWQVLGTSPTSTTSFASGHGPSFLETAWGVVMVYGLALIGAPWVAWRRRQDHAFALTMAFMWLTTLYVAVLTNLVEIGENNRFRVDLGPVVLVMAAVVIDALAREIRQQKSPGLGHDELRGPTETSAVETVGAR